LVNEVLKKVEEKDYKRVTIDDIIEVLCKRFNAGEEDLRSKY